MALGEPQKFMIICRSSKITQMMYFKQVLYNQANIQCFAKRESKLPKNETINILYDFHDFLIPAYVHHVYCHLLHVNWHLDNP